MSVAMIRMARGVYICPSRTPVLTISWRMSHETHPERSNPSTLRCTPIVSNDTSNALRHCNSYMASSRSVMNDPESRTVAMGSRRALLYV